MRGRRRGARRARSGPGTAGREAGREGVGLGEADADALAGERVHVARRVADEERAAVDAAADVLAHGSRAAYLAGRGRATEAVEQRRERGQAGLEVAARASRSVLAKSKPMPTTPAETGVTYASAPGVQWTSTKSVHGATR